MNSLDKKVNLFKTAAIITAIGTTILTTSLIAGYIEKKISSNQSNITYSEMAKPYQYTSYAAAVLILSTVGSAFASLAIGAASKKNYK